MSDRIKAEEASAVEDAPALVPRSDLPQSPACRPGDSPYRDDIDDLVDASLKRGPYGGRSYMQCPNCTAEWHGFQNGNMCQGSHIRKTKGGNEIREQGMDRPGNVPSDS